MAEKRERRSKRAFHLVVKRERCKGCYLCMHVCPKHVFDKEEGFNAKGYQPVRAARPQDCTGCRACTIVCPDVVFELYELAETA